MPATQKQPEKQPEDQSEDHPKVEAKKVYLKDASFESPASPQVFGQGEIKPDLDVQMTLTHRQIDQAHYEVVLSTTVTATFEKRTMFLAEVQQAGVFELTHVAATDIEVVLETACPQVLLPFARETVASIISKGGFPQLLINPINFQALYQQKKEKEARSVQPSGQTRPN